MQFDWPIVPLGELTLNLDTKRKPVKEADRRPGPFPYYGASGVVDYVDGFLFEGEHLLIAEDGENLRTRNTPVAFRATGRFWVNNHAHIVKGNERARTRYLEYALLGTDISPFLTGAVMPKLTQGNLNKIPVPCPSIRQQDAVISVLGALDDRIDLLRQTNATLESIAQALFKSWFIDFDPVRAKAEGREPEGMDAATAALFPAEFEESELGLIPKGWSVTALAERCEVQIGGVWGEEAQTPKASMEVCCLRGIDAVDLANGELPVPPVRWVTPKQIESRRLHAGDILVEGSGSFCGRSLLWADSYEQLVPLTATYSNFVKRLSAPAGPHYARWVQRHLDLVYQSGEVKNYRTGSAFPNLDLQAMLGVTRILPPERLLLHFDALIRSFESQRVSRIERAATLVALRDALLPRLISGKLRIPEAQDVVVEAIG